MIIGIGIDMLDLTRFTNLVEKYGKSILDEIFAETELKAAYAMTDPIKILAINFAAKEAIFKSLDIKWHEYMTWKDIQVDLDNQGVVLSETIKQIIRHADPKFMFSWCYTEQYICCSVIYSANTS